MAGKTKSGGLKLLGVLLFTGGLGMLAVNPVLGMWIMGGTLVTAAMPAKVSELICLCGAAGMAAGLLIALLSPGVLGVTAALSYNMGLKIAAYSLGTAVLGAFFSLVKEQLNPIKKQSDKRSLSERLDEYNRARNSGVQSETSARQGNNGIGNISGACAGMTVSGGRNNDHSRTSR